jgi:hypothetical protein
MVTTTTTSRNHISESDADEELPFEFHITGTIKTGDDDRHPRYQITDVRVSPTDEDDLDHDVDGDDEVEDDAPAIRISKLRHKESGSTDRRVVKKKRRQDDDDEEPEEEEEDSGLYYTDPRLDDTESLDDWDDGDETIMSCIQKSMVRRR